MHDLGIDGDDASGLFDLYQERFKFHLNELQWSRHFGSEGIPLTFGIGLLVYALIVGLIAGIVGLPKWAAIVFGLAGVVIWLWPLRQWPLKPVTLIPITIGDLIVSARAGRWIDLNDRPTEP